MKHSEDLRKNKKTPTQIISLKSTGSNEREISEKNNLSLLYEVFWDKPVQRGSSKLGDSAIIKGIKIYFKIAFSSGVGWEKGWQKDIRISCWITFIMWFFFWDLAPTMIYIFFNGDFRASFSKMEILSHHLNLLKRNLFLFLVIINFVLVLILTWQHLSAACLLHHFPLQTPHLPEVVPAATSDAGDVAKQQV